MTLLLLDTNLAMCEAWESCFAGVDGATVYHGAFEHAIGAFDCLVSPANSFGLMDGGIDAAITNFFGPALEQRVQQEIWRQYRGEQPVGTCLMVETGDSRCPWLAHCPTMRVPMDVSWTNHAYAAYLAALTTAEMQGIEVLASAGLATGVGHMPPGIAARQMRYAYDIWSGPQARPGWEVTHEREWRSSGRTRADFLRHKFG